MRSPIYLQAIIAITLMCGAAVAAAGIGVFASVSIIEIVPAFVQREARTLQSIQRLSSDARTLISVTPRYANITTELDLGTLNNMVSDQVRLLNEAMVQLSEVLSEDLSGSIDEVRDAQHRLVDGLDQMNSIAQDRLALRLSMNSKRKTLHELAPRILCLLTPEIAAQSASCGSGVDAAYIDTKSTAWALEAGQTIASVRTAMHAQKGFQLRRALKEARTNLDRALTIEAGLNPSQKSGLGTVLSDFQSVFAEEAKLLTDLAEERALDRRLEGAFSRSSFDASRLIAAMATLVSNVNALTEGEQRNLVTQLKELVNYMIGLMGFCILIALVGFLFLRNRVIGRLRALQQAVQSGNRLGSETIDVRSNIRDEIGDIARAYNQVQGEVELREERLRKERDSAKTLAREADDANRAKSNFLSQMSHELRTPLNAIIGFSELIRMRNTDSDRVAEYSKDILDSGQHLLKIVNDILELSKIEAQKVDLNIEPVPARRVIDEAINLVRPTALEKEISISVTAEEITVDADRLALRRVLVNLLSNAVKFSEAGKRIWVEARQGEANGQVELSVRDEGVGIEEQALGTILEPFRQEDDHYVSTSGGIGLGLAIVDSIMKLHGGSVDIQSKKNVGTTVTVRFPPRPDVT